MLKVRPDLFTTFDAKSSLSPELLNFQENDKSKGFASTSQLILATSFFAIPYTLVWLALQKGASGQREN